MEHAGQSLWSQNACAHPSLPAALPLSLTQQHTGGRGPGRTELHVTEAGAHCHGIVAVAGGSDTGNGWPASRTPTRQERGGETLFSDL